MTKRELALLEKIWIAEVEGALAKNRAQKVFQTRSALIHKLHAMGMVQPETITLDGRFHVKVSGWLLTHAGRLTYCATC